MKTGLAGTLSRSLTLLEASTRDDGMLFSDAVVVLGVAPSTAARLLRGLVDAELLSHASDGRYRTTTRLQRLASSALESGLEARAAPIAERLAASTSQSAAVFVPVEDGVRMLAKCEPAERFRYMPVGGINRDLMHHGFCQLRAAWLKPKTALRLVRAQILSNASAPAAATTPHTPAAAGEEWLQRLPALKNQGWIVQVHDDQAGLGRIVAACIRPDGELAALVGVTATSAIISAQRHRLLEAVRAAASALLTASGTAFGTTSGTTSAPGSRA